MDAYKYYPGYQEVDAWIASLWEDADSIDVRTEESFTDPFKVLMYPFQAVGANRFIKFSPEGMDEFYAFFQPVVTGPAPLLVHTSGYGAEVSYHTELAAAGFNVLHIQPLGYVSPEGKELSKERDGSWPVLPDTVTTGAKGGYRTWLLNCIMAVKCALKQSCVLPERVSFFGTSQGGGGSLLLGSIFKDKGTRAVAAEQPFLTDFPGADFKGAYNMVRKVYEEAEDKEAAWKAMGYIDTISHACRLEIPVLLTSGTADRVCPQDTVESLFSRLPGTKSYTNFSCMSHGYSREFIQLAMAWFRLYA